jgi:putative N-acetylmannosamine-6-phosphate epimerase
VTTLDDFLSENEEAIISMSIADRILLARSLLDSVSSTLVGATDATDDSSDEDYECVEEDEDY